MSSKTELDPPIQSHVPVSVRPLRTAPEQTQRANVDRKNAVYSLGSHPKRPPHTLHKSYCVGYLYISDNGCDFLQQPTGTSLDITHTFVCRNLQLPESSSHPSLSLTEKLSPVSHIPLSKTWCSFLKTRLERVVGSFGNHRAWSEPHAVELLCNRRMS